VSSNLDLVKSIYADWERGDWSSADWADAEIQFEMIGGVGEGRWSGKAQMGEAWATILAAWEDFRAIPGEFRELDDQRVLVFLENSGRGKGSGIDVREIAAKSANVFTIQGGKVVKLVAYWDRDRAIDELGLAES
jgi:hypothetical protein